jgi:hypothetical protein
VELSRRLAEGRGSAVSEQNAQTVRTIYRLWSENRSAGSLIDSQLEYVNPSYAVESGTRRERRALASVREVYPDFRVEPERFPTASGAPRYAAPPAIAGRITSTSSGATAVSRPPSTRTSSSLRYTLT